MMAVTSVSSEALGRAGDASKAKDDARLPMTDHNTRIFVVGSSGSQARSVAEATVRDAFHHVAF
jgi:hypothetical protein